MTQVFPLCALALLALTSSLMAQGTGLFARVSSVSGGALLSSGNGSGSFPLSRGYALNPGDQVDTRQGGRVVIDLSDGSLVVVHPGTFLTIKDFRAAASVRELFDIALGMVRVKIHHLTGKPNPYRMNSPTASVAVRGTEFDVTVDDTGATSIDVIEGAVEVARLDDPQDHALIEAGHGALVRPGTPLQLVARPVAALGPGSHRPDFDRNGGEKLSGPPPVRMEARRSPNAPPGFSGGVKTDDKPAMMNRPPDPGQRQEPPGPTVLKVPAPDLALLAGPEAPLLYRFNAFADLHMDTYENPAYATTARQNETRASLYGTSPQVSVVQLLGRGFLAGGSVNVSASGSTMRAAQDSLSPATQLAGIHYSSFSAFAARSFGASGAGFSVERMRTSGVAAADSSFVNQTRFTTGLTTRVGAQTDLGVYARYSILDSGVNGSRLGLRADGRGIETGFRLRGAMTPKLSWGLTGNVGTSGIAEVSVGTASLAGGFGYALTVGTVFSADLATGRVSSGNFASPFTSMHASIHREFNKHLFATASFLHTWRNDSFALPLWRNQYVELGAGWRFGQDWIAQYMVSTDDILAGPRHIVALRYTLRQPR